MTVTTVFSSAMDPVSHIVLGWSLNLGFVPRIHRATHVASGVDTRGHALAIALGSLSPDIDVLLMPTGWDRYLVAHEVGTHSAVGAIICGALAAGVAAMLRRRGYRPLLVPAVIGSTSHVIADLLSGATIRIGWPFFDERVTNLGVVAMADPFMMAGTLIAGLAMMLWSVRRRQVALVTLGALALVVVEKTILRERAELAYREHSARSEAVGGYLVEPVWGTMMQWRVFDRTSDRVRAWTVDGSNTVNTYAQVPLVVGQATMVETSLRWGTVRNFRHTHDFAFAVATEAGVEWSDLRYCGPGAQFVNDAATLNATETGPRPECGIWAGGELSSPAGTPRLIVRVGDFVQTR